MVSEGRQLSEDGLWVWDGSKWQPIEPTVIGGGKLSGGSPDIEAGGAVLLVLRGKWFELGIAMGSRTNVIVRYPLATLGAPRVETSERQVTPLIGAISPVMGAATKKYAGYALLRITAQVAGPATVAARDKKQPEVRTYDAGTVFTHDLVIETQDAARAADQLQMRINAVGGRAATGVSTPQSSVAAPGTRDTSGSVADELAKLAKLRDDGVLTDAEFASAKSRLLSAL